MKAFASDYDGTIYFKGKSFDDADFKASDLAAIKQFQKEGYLFGTCTGRPFLGAYLPAKGKIDFDFYIVSSGACIKDKDLKIIYKNCLTRDLMKKIYDRYINDVIIYVQCDDYLYASEVKEYHGEDLIEFNSLEEIPNKNVYSISLICHSISQAHRFANEIKEDYGFILDAFQNVDSVDVVMKGCSKGAAVKLVKKLLNIDEIYGIGDSYNDIPMLVEADASFTFYNSPEEVQQQATYLVGSVEEAIKKVQKK